MNTRPVDGLQEMASKREPVFKVPGVVLATIVVLGVVHLLRQVVSTDNDDRLVADLAFVPLRLTAIIAPDRVWQHLASWGLSADVELRRTADVGAFFLGRGAWSGVTSLLTYAFLHGNWTHLGLNCVWLLAFGTPVARRFGVVRFSLFMAATAIAGALLHWALFPMTVMPLVGASAAVSGCMGAAVRFAFRTPTMIDGEQRFGVDESLKATLKDRRAVLFIAVWFVTNAVFGLGSSLFGMSDAPVAWQAHIGGLLVGLLGFGLFAPSRLPEVEAAIEEPHPPLAS